MTQDASTTPLTKAALQSAVQSAVQTSEGAYTTAVNSFVGSVFATMDSNGWNTQLRQSAQDYGWASAGIFYVAIARLQGLVYELSDVTYSEVPINLDYLDKESEMYRLLVGPNGKEGASGSDPTVGSMNQVNALWPADKPIPTGASSAGIADGDGTGDLSILDGAVKMLNDVNPANPIGSMVGFGHMVLDIFWTVLLAVIAAGTVATAATGGVAAVGGKIAASALLKNPIISGLIAKASFVLMLIIGIAVAVGAIHAFVIPMIPYINVLFAVMGMLTLTAESLIAAPLWAFAHIRFDGGGFVDQAQKPGYMIAFNMLLRPTLTIFGVALSMAVFGAMAWFVSETFIPAARAAASGHTVGIIGTIVMVILAPTSITSWRSAPSP